MRRRLLLLTAFTSALVIAVMVIAVSPLIRTQVTNQLDQRVRGEVLAVAGYILTTAPSDTALDSYLRQVDTVSGTVIGVRTADLTYLGRGAAGVAQRWPKDVTLDAGPARPPVHLDPRIYDAPSGDRIASQGVFVGPRSWIIEGTIAHQAIADQQRQHWVLIIVAAVVALLLALTSADVLARRLVKPLKAAVRATESIGRGRLDTEVPTEGPREVIELGTALLYLSARIDRLLASERERAATLSHRLRTPLTVLSLETERLETELVERPEQLRRVQLTIAELERSLDDLIIDSQRTREEGVTERADAVQVLSTHYSFWRTLATTQNRTTTLLTEVDTLEVIMSTQQLGTTLDALFSNIFRHTPPGTPYGARIWRKDGFAAIELSNDQPVSDSNPLLPGGIGSTGMGLRLATQAVEASGGHLTTSDHDGKILVTLDLALTYRAAPA